MPTGLTAPIIEGKITTLKAFAHECSSQFVWSRLAGEKLTILEDNYYAHHLAESNEALLNWINSTEEDRYRLWSEYHNKLVAAGKVFKAEKEEAHDRLQPILDAAKAQEVPKSHARFKEFMIQQLEDTIRYDATYDPTWYTPMEFYDWCAKHERDLNRGVEIALENYQRHNRNTAESRQWIDTLVSLYDLGEYT